MATAFVDPVQRAFSLGQACGRAPAAPRPAPTPPPYTINQVKAIKGAAARGAWFGRLPPNVASAAVEMNDWSSILAYFRTFGHSRHQIEGYERFCDDILPTIIRENSRMTFYGKHRHHTVEFGDVYIIKPTVYDMVDKVRPLYPHEARVRSSTYSINICVNIIHKQRDFTEEEIRRQLERKARDRDKRVKRKASAMVGGTDPALPSSEAAARAPPAREPCAPAEVVYRCISLCRLPCMVRSKYCNLSGESCGRPEASQGEDTYDEGGYLIINGNEKLLIDQLRLRHNRIYVFLARKNDKYSFVCEIRSLHTTKNRSTSTVRMGIARNAQDRVSVVVNLPFVLRGNTPLSIPFALMWSAIQSVGERASGRDDPLVDRLLASQPACVRKTVRQLLNHSLGALSPEEARQWIQDYTQPPSNSTPVEIHNILRSEFLPHIGLNNAPRTLSQKRKFFLRALLRMVRVYHRVDPVDDRDSFVNRCVHNTDALIAIIFRQIWRHTLKSMRGNICKTLRLGKRIDISDFVRSRKMTAALKYHFATGNWSLQQNVNTGVVMSMPRICHRGTLSFKRKINTQCNKDGKATECRHLHPSDPGISCVCETPEGQSCGLIENFAMLATVSMGAPIYSVAKVVRRFPGGLTPYPSSGGEAAGRKGLGKEGAAGPRTAAFTACPPAGCTDVLVNGIAIGYTQRPRACVEWVRAMRRTHLALPCDITAVLDDNRGGVLISCEVGKCVRPLLRLSEAHRIQAIRTRYGDPPPLWWSQDMWTTLVHEGVVEYMDKEEELCGDYLVAPTPRDLMSGRPYTHAEMNPAVILGLVSCSQPFANHNQAPRNIYQTSMGKQALGLVVQNWKDRYDRHLYVTNYPQRPLVMTPIETLPPQDQHPQGQMITLMINCYGGENQEDSVLVSQRAIDNGFGRLAYYRTYQDRGVIGSERYEIPGPDVCGRKGNADYSKLDTDGMPRIGAVVSRGDVIIGKTVTVMANKNAGGGSVTFDQSVIMQDNDTGRIDDVVRTTTHEGKMLVKVRIRIERTPIVGDKFASRHAQKGTIGRIVPTVDMPFMRDGTIPDVIMNPNAIPSRMTVGQLIETLLGKLCARTGHRGDGTPFRNISIDQIGEELKRHGMHPGGKERMRNGMTGEEIEALMFVGPTYYQQLKHMVKDKIHSRGSVGLDKRLTRQPMDGRSRNGGFRFGEMERDALICHGASRLMLDRMYDCSDKYVAPICQLCGSIGVPGTPQDFRQDRRQAWCLNCLHDRRRTPEELDGCVKQVKMPYATKLLTQELMAMHILPEYQLGP